MAKLNQIIAVEKGVKSRALRELTDIYHAFQKPDLLSGVSKTYQPLKEDDAETLPGEKKRVQVKVEESLARAQAVMTELFDVTATKDWANGRAAADVVLDGQALLPQVPVTYLLFLEKQLTDLRTTVAALPTLDPAQVWRYDPAQACYAAEPVVTARTKKVPRAFVKAEATDKHPAQVEVFHEDVDTGRWTRVDYSGSLPRDRVDSILARINALLDAVKVAREAANSLEVESVKVGAAVFAYVFGEGK